MRRRGEVRAGMGARDAELLFFMIFYDYGCPCFSLFFLCMKDRDFLLFLIARAVYCCLLFLRTLTNRRRASWLGVASGSFSPSLYFLGAVTRKHD
jgi:hypothetical protein